MPSASGHTAQHLRTAERQSTEEAPRRRRRRRSRSKEDEWPIRVGFLALAFCALLTLAMLGPFMTYESDAVAGTGQLARQLGYISIALLTAYSVRALKVPKRLLVVPVWVAVAVGWCWLSVTWAFDPRISVRRLVLMTIVLWSSFVLVRQLGYRSTLLLIRGALVLLLAVNYIAVFNYPEVGVHQFDRLGEGGLSGDWRGIMAHKNMAGLVTALTILYFAFDSGRIPKLVQLPVLIAAGIFLWFSSSRTSVGVCVAALIVGFLYSWYRFKYRPVAIGVLVVLTLIGAVIQNIYSDPFLRVLNDPTAFTGRTVIWAAMWAFYRNFPLFGAGYGSFWNIGPASPINQYGSDWLLQVAEGHNGYMDLLVTIGPVGLALVVLATMILPIAKLLNWRRSEGQTGALLMAVLIFMIGHNATESTLFDRDSIGQVFLMVTVAMIWTVTGRGRSAMAGGVDLFSWANRSEDKPDSANA